MTIGTLCVCFYFYHVILEAFVGLRWWWTVCDWTVQLLFKVTHCFLDLIMTQKNLLLLNVYNTLALQSHNYSFFVAEYLFKVIIVSLPVRGALVELSSQLLHSPLQLFPVAPHLCKSCPDTSSLSRGHKARQGLTVCLHVGKGCPSLF